MNVDLQEGELRLLLHLIPDRLSPVAEKLETALSQAVRDRIAAQLQSGELKRGRKTES